MNPNTPQEPTLKTSSVLIVEDDGFLREIYLDTLKRGGYTVEAAVDGDDGYEKIKNGKYDLILLDIIMPKKDGLQVMRTLKSDPTYTSTTPVVFLTNLDNDAEIKQALQLGKGYLIKSQMTPADLLKEVKVFLSATESPASVVPPAVTPEKIS